MGILRKSSIRNQANGRIFQQRYDLQLRQCPKKIIERSSKLHTDLSNHYIPKFFKSKYGCNFAPPKKNLNLKVFELSDEESFYDSAVSFILHFKRQIHFKNNTTQCLKRVLQEKHNQEEASLEIQKTKLKTPLKKKKKFYSVRKSNFLDYNVEKYYLFDESCEQIEKDVSIQSKLIDDIFQKKFETKVKTAEMIEKCEVFKHNGEEKNESKKLIENYKIIIANSGTDNDISCEEFDAIRKNPVISDVTKIYETVNVKSHSDPLKNVEVKHVTASDDAVVPITPKKKVTRRKICVSESSSCQSPTKMNDVDVNLYDSLEILKYKEVNEPIDEKHVIHEPLEEKLSEFIDRDQKTDENAALIEKYKLFDDQFQDDMHCYEHLDQSSVCDKDDNIQEEQNNEQSLVINIAEQWNSEDIIQAGDVTDGSKFKSDSMLIIDLTSSGKSAYEIKNGSYNSQNKIEDQNGSNQINASYNLDQSHGYDQNLNASSLHEIQKASNIDLRSKIKKSKQKVKRKKTFTKRNKKIKTLNEPSPSPINNELPIMIESDMCKSKDCAKHNNSQTDDPENHNEIQSTSKNVSLQILNSENTNEKSDKLDEVKLFKKVDYQQECHQVTLSDVCTSHDYAIASIKPADNEMLNYDIISSAVSVDIENLDKNKKEIPSKLNKGKWSVKYVKKKKAKSNKKKGSAIYLKQDEPSETNVELKYISNAVSECHKVIDLISPERIETIQPSQNEIALDDHSILVNAYNDEDDNGPCGLNDAKITLDDNDSHLENIEVDVKHSKSKKQKAQKKRQKKIGRKKSRNISRKSDEVCGKEFYDFNDVEKSLSVVKSLDITPDLNDSISDNIETTNFDIPSKALNLTPITQSGFADTNCREIEQRLHETSKPVDKEMSDQKAVERCQIDQNNSNSPVESEAPMVPVKVSKAEFKIVSSSPIPDQIEAVVADETINDVKCKSSLSVIQVKECFQRFSIDFNALLSSLPQENHESFEDEGQTAEKLSDELCTNPRISPEISNNFDDSSRNNSQGPDEEIADRIIDFSQNDWKLKSSVSKSVCLLQKDPAERDNSEQENHIPQKKRRVSFSEITVVNVFADSQDDSKRIRLNNRIVDEYDITQVASDALPLKKLKTKSILKVSKSTIFNNDGNANQAVQNHSQLCEVPSKLSVPKSSKSVIAEIFIDDFITRKKLLTDFITQQEYSESLFDSEESPMNLNLRDLQKNKDTQHSQNETENIDVELVKEHHSFSTDEVESICSNWLSNPIIQKEQKTGWADHLYSNQ